MKPKYKITDNVVYVTFGQGHKWYRLDSVLAKTKSQAEAREVRDNETLRRKFERLMTVSRDLPNSAASRATVADRHTEGEIDHRVNMLFAQIFPANQLRTLTDKEKLAKVMDAAHYVAKQLGYINQTQDGYKEIIAIFVTIYHKGREGRRELMERYHLSRNAFVYRVNRYREIIETRAEHGGVPQGI